MQARAMRTIDRHFLVEFDSFLQKESFRHLHVKLHLDYYKNFVLLLLKMPEDLLDWLYADANVFLATWPSGINPRLRFYSDTASCDAQGFGFLLLGDSSSSQTLHLVYKEDRLVLTYFRCTIRLLILSLPGTRLERERREEVILQAFEVYLSSREFKMYFRETFRDTVKTVQACVAGNTATLGLSTTVSTLGHATAGFAFTLAVDVAVTIRALSKARKLRKDGEITDREYKTTVKRKVRQTGCQLVGGSTGSMIGQIVIPVPVVGAMIGGFVGSMIGTGLSKGMDKIDEVRGLKKPVQGLRRDATPTKAKNINERFRNIRAKFERSSTKCKPTSQ